MDSKCDYRYDPTGKQIPNGTSRGGKYKVTQDGHLTKLEIYRISISDFGNYTLWAHNTKHRESEEFTLLVEGIRSNLPM